MKLVSYFDGQREHLGVFIDDKIYNLHDCDPAIPDRMNELLWGGKALMEQAGNITARIQEGSIPAQPASAYRLLAPVPHPSSCRDGYAFRQHVATARRNRGLDMIPEYDHFPVFYFTNHQSIQGEGPIRCMPDHLDQLDFELELAIVLNKKGRNIPASRADAYIAGYMIMNDVSARGLQLEEMKLNLGPAKGKDFCTAIGPWLVTPDELAPYQIPARPGHSGARYALDMTCRVNGELVSKGSAADMDWTFAEILERCSYGVDLFPGDVIGSGTVGTGCFLELNGTGRLNDPGYREQWLQPGDRVEMEITGLGCLTNTVVVSPES